ncbi:hypothetical protein ACHAXR_009615 [Thalassiosira sp. AJA248-18]
MAPSPQIQMLRHTARTALSQSRRRRLLPSSSLSAVHLTRDVHQHDQRRPLGTGSTAPLYAQPHKYVTGVTSQQVDQSQAIQDWYKANFKDWQDEPEKIIIGEENDEDDKEAEEDAVVIDPSAIILPDHLAKRNIRPLAVYLRGPHEEGSRVCRKLRMPGVNDPNFPLIPGILHGSDPTQSIVSVDHSSKVLVKTPWFEIQRELDKYHYGINGSFENRVYALTIFPSEEAHLDHHRSRHPKDKTTYRLDEDTMTVIETPGPPLPVPPPRTPIEGMEHILVIPSDLHMHPVAHAPYCLNYKRYHPSKPIKIKIKMINEEESPTIKRGGFLALVNHFIEVLVEDGAPIPEFIELECTGLRQKDVVRRDRLIIPEGVTIHPRVPGDYLMGTVYGVRGGDAVDGGEGEAGEGGGDEN